MRIEKPIFQPLSQSIPFQPLSIIKEKEIFTKSSLSSFSFEKIKTNIKYFFFSLFSFFKRIFCCECFQSTLERQRIWKATKSFFENPKHEKAILALNLAKRNTRYYKLDSFFKENQSTVLHTTNKNEAKIFVKMKDPIDIGVKLKGKGINPLLFNFHIPRANDDTGVDDEIYLRTGLAFTLHENKNVEDTDNAIVYSPYVPVIRKGKKKNYRFLKSPKCLSFATINNAFSFIKESLDKKNTEKIHKIIHSQLLLARLLGYDSLVFYANGREFFTNHPNSVVNMYISIIEKDFLKNFKEIVFAVPNSLETINKEDLSSFINGIQKTHGKNVS